MTSPRAARSALLTCTLVAGLLLGLRPTALHAQAPDAARLRLESLLADVEAANPALRAARLDAAARARVSEQVGALPDPTVSLMVAPSPVFTAGRAPGTQWRVEQMVPWPGTLGLRARAAELGAEVATHEAEALALDLALEVKRAYYDLYRLQRADTLVRAFGGRLDAFVEAAATRYEVGRGPQGAVLQVRLEEERLQERLLALDARREAAVQALARLTGRPELVLARVVVLEPPPLPAEEAALDALALRLRPEVRALDAAARRADADVALARKAFYPDLGVGLVYTDAAARDMPSMTDGMGALGVMLSARVPLQRGRLRAQLDEARLRREEVAARREALELAVRTELAELVRLARREAETLALYRERLLPQAQATVESVLAAYTTGTADYTAFLEAERTRFGIALGLEDALGRYLDATARLERALGGTPLDGLPGDLAAPASTPRPDATDR